MIHGLLAAGLGLCVWQHDRQLQDAGRVVQLMGVVGLFAGAMGVGLFPVPGAVLRWLQPGTAAAAPERWHTLSWSAPDSLDALTLAGIAAGALVVAGVWGASQPRHRTVERAVTIGTLIVAGTAVLHATTGATSLFGIVETWIRPPDRFFAPFLNENHLASILLLSWPLWLDQLLDPEAGGHRRTVAGCFVGVVSGLFAWTGSLGAAAAAIAVAVVIAVFRGWLPRLVAFAGALLSGACVAGMVVLDPLSAHGRTDLWLASLSLWADHPWFGSGAGTFGQAIDAYRTDSEFIVWHHAHNDVLQWLAETGLVGAVVLGLMVRWWITVPASHSPERDRWMVLGGLAVLLHALVEFPLHVPGILFATCSLLAVHHVAFRAPMSVDPWRLRLGLGVLMGLQLGMGAWQVRTAIEEPAVRAVLARSGEAGRAVRQLSTVAPWRPEIALYEAWSLQSAGRQAEAIERARQVAQGHPADPVAQRLAAELLVREGALNEARAIIERTVTRDPSDWRGWLTRAEVVEGHEPSARAEAWMDAIRRGAPVHLLRRAWADLPVGLAWVEAVEGRPPRFSRAMGHVLASLDPDAALVAFDQARVADGVVDPAQIRLLVELDRLPEADLLLQRGRADRPEDPRLLRLQAELRARQGRDADAARSWLALAEEDSSAQLSTLRAVRQAQGLDSALALAEMWLLEGGSRSLDPRARLEHARLLLAAERPEACTDRIRRSGLLADEQFGDEARRILARCSRVTGPLR